MSDQSISDLKEANERWKKVVEKTVPGLFTKYPLGPQNDAEYWSVRACLAEANQKSLERKIEKLQAELGNEAKLLRGWATEAYVGGWSTEHVAPMRTRADLIEIFLAEVKRS